MRAEPLTGEAFAPFGAVLARPESSPDASGPGWRWWAEACELRPQERPYAIGFLALDPAEPAFDWAEYHRHTVELILPLDGDCLVYVAPPAEEPRDFRVFRVEAGTGVLLRPRVWHGAPLAPEHAMSAAVFLRRGTGKEDTVVVRFPESPLRVEVP